MTIGNSKLSEAAAHQELILMDSRVAGVIDENYFDRFRRRDLAQADVLERFAGLLDETRICAGKNIHLGKIICNEILEFLERIPEVPSGFLLTSGLRILSELVPFIGPTLVPISSAAESHGFGRAFSGTNFEERLCQQARIFFGGFAEILNLCKGLLSDSEKTDLEVITFEEPVPFELDASEDPFSLDDVEEISETAAAIIKFLARLAMAEGSFSDAEKQLIVKLVEEIGEPVSRSQLERLIQQASGESLEIILKPVARQDTHFSEKLLLAGMLLTAADGRVETIEKKLLVQSAHLLGISRERYSEIARDAVHLIKARNTELPGRKRTEISSANATPRIEAADRSIPEKSLKQEGMQALSDRKSDGSVIVPKPPPLREKTDVTSERIIDEMSQSYQKISLNKPTVQQRAPSSFVWRCPACHMPQVREYDECPQCGIIVAKFNKLSGNQPVTVPDEYIDVPPESEIEEPADHLETSQKTLPPACPVCRSQLRADAKFCHACGNRIH